MSSLAGAPTRLFAAGKAEHIVVVVWDGMRPDFIRPQYTPTLSALARDGVLFKNHHAVFVSSTEVNGTALATGMYPEHTGIMANSDYRPEIGWLGPTGTETLEAVRRGDLLSGGNYLSVPTLPEILQKAGHPTIVAGTKPVALLFDRSTRRPSRAAADSVNLYAGRTIPHATLQSIVKINEKDFPTNNTQPNIARDTWTTKGLTQVLWKKSVPKFTVIWLSDPDVTQHETSPGSDTSMAALDSSDRNLSEILKALDEKKVFDKTDVFIVSDHGFSSVQRGPDIAEILKKNRFKATRKFEDPEPGEVLVVGNGGSVSFYVVDDDQTVIRNLVGFLQTSDFAGVIFSRAPIEGTFPLEQVRIGTTNAPDVLVSLRWSAEKNEFGTPGMVVADNLKKGKHASLSRFDMNNTLVAFGPDFRRGFIDELPTGNADLAPTILWILGVKPPQPLDGRILTEALANHGGPPPKSEQKIIEASRELELFRWRQYLKYSTVGNSVYFDEGNGESTLK
jgi:arylsulfatase A-like enzyme